MSALGQKQTFAAHKLMSALTPKADMCDAQANVRYVPRADIRKMICANRKNRLAVGLSSGYPFIKWLPKAVRPLSNTAAKTLHNSQSKSLHGVNFSAVKQNKVEDNRKDQRGEYTLQHNRCSRSR
ncbi:MAG: hypothetical protein WCF56_22745 [Pseudolabrys sp.]